MASDAAIKRVQAMHDHVLQINEGKIPEDSPADFVAPADGLDADGRPWWFGPEYSDAPSLDIPPDS